MADKTDGQESLTDLFLDVEGFNNSSVFKEDKLRSSLISDLPWQHIIRERIICILYINEEKIAENNKPTYGNYVEGGEKGPDILYIYKQPDDKVKDKDKRPFMRHAVYHEVSHSAYSHLREKARKEWQSLYEPDKPERRVGSKISSPEEDFAESFAYYVQDPEFLKDVNSEKYNFLRLHVFNCREYPEYRFP